MSYNKEAERDRKKGTALLPAMGFILIVALGIISWFLSDPVRDFIDRRSGADLSGIEMRYLVTFVLFIVFVMLVGLIYTIAIPKKRDDVKDKDLYKERKALELEKQARKERRRQVKRDMRK
jgi:hypothetical protein